MFSTAAKTRTTGVLLYRLPLRKASCCASFRGLPNLPPTRLGTGPSRSSTQRQQQQGVHLKVQGRANAFNSGSILAAQSWRWSSSLSSSSSSSWSQQTTSTLGAPAKDSKNLYGRRGGLYRRSLTFPPNYRVSLLSQSVLPTTRYYSSTSSGSSSRVNSLLVSTPQHQQVLHPMPPRVGYRPTTIRNLSTGGNQKKDSTDSSSSSTGDAAKTTDTKTSSEANNDSTSSRMAEASKAVRQRVEQVEERLSKVLHDVVAVSTGDQLAAAAIAVLLIGLVAAPYVISQMKASNRNYDYLADTDDPVDDFTQLAKEEWDSPDATRVSALENILSELVQSKALQQAAKQFVLQLVEAPEVKAALQRLLMSLWKDLVEDPETIKQVINLLAVAIADEQVKVAAQKLVLDLVAEPEVQASLVAAVNKLGVDSEVQTTLQALLTSTAHNTLNDAEVLDHSMEFATDVLGDDAVQQTAGEALRNTVRHAFKPAATMGLTATGVGLMLFGILALGYARSSEHEARLLDTAARSLQANAAYGLQRLVTWPARAFGGSLAWLQQGVITAWSALTTALAHNTGRLGQWIARGVTHTGASLGAALGQSWQSIWGSTWGAIHSVWSAAVQSALGRLQGTLQLIQHAWAFSNTSLLQWSWDVVLWGRHLSWLVFSWMPRTIGQTTTWRNLQDLWQRLMGRFVGLS
eukprot:scaffold3364_cov161-Amphora_coffeaeformis.AAC.5